MSTPTTTAPEDRQARSAHSANGGGTDVSTRLLRSAAKKSYDPAVDIDWDAPLDPQKSWTPEHRVSLYGTPLWDALDADQRHELAKHEACSIAGAGVWFETLLMQRLLKDFYDADPATDRAQWALTEVADECRHSQMFTRMTQVAGVPTYGPVPWVRRLSKLYSVVTWGPSAYATILVAEEVLDRLQREQAEDPDVQPLMRQVNKIHVMEEARHVSFARAEVTDGMARLSRPARAYHRLATALVSFLIVRSLIHPEVYSAVGIEPGRGRREALANPHYREMIRWAGEKILGFLDEAGMVKGPGTAVWRRAFLLPRRSRA
ncbi:diiron oxygenase [Actinomycetospora sp.]|uniref:AurF N-oxygenase family protein n=1 Tax=Actinomycetospora sp. TaxID=1872135 RepID=UPI002F3EB14D